MSRAHRNFSFVLFVYLFVLIWREPYAYVTRSVIFVFLFAWAFTSSIRVCLFHVHEIWYFLCLLSIVLGLPSSPFFPCLSFLLFICSLSTLFSECCYCFTSCIVPPPLHIAPLYQPTNHPTQKKQLVHKILSTTGLQD